MQNIFHCLIIEGSEKDTISKAKSICISILGDDFKNKINKDICSDIIRINQKNNKKSIGIDEIRSIKSDIIIKPVECKSKVYIIENSHKMTEQAQNALLKTIEEPPPFIYFILLCDNSEKLLDTVKSRANIIRLYSDDNEILDVHKLFVDSFVDKNQFEILKILNQYNKKEDLKDFLEISKVYLINKIKNNNINFNSKLFEKLDYCINSLKYNLNTQLVVQYLCID